ncbi:atp synthase f0 [Moniliophthora roreri MCA 2997]|uniref:Atp synthase f0 n=1 Tax=Moniliophthora roreri (strain MCA 2997) TaxID=1381753 RepID=V2YM31_MONRO|nr:atp synthase f0 [Moniliophthora roreri MCA 2997]
MSSCKPHHDWFTAALTFGLCCGLVISYVPQHYRIIRSGSSEGLSPWFLLLGTTSSAAGMLNMFTMQWGIVRCCRVLSFGSCLEMTAGVIQVGLQWAMFTLIFILYMIYYPPHLKYKERQLDLHDSRPRIGVKMGKRTKEWRSSIALSGAAIAHFFIITITTFFLLITFPPSPSPTPSPSPEPIPLPTPDSPLSHSVQQWATFLGVSSALLAAVQYVPQIAHTWQSKVVGALSIPMMCIQTPGAVLMVLSIALRPGTNWTSWITFAVAGIMQGTLLVMCISWKIRQHRLAIDDFGNPLPENPQYASFVEAHTTAQSSYTDEPSSSLVISHPAADVDVPGLMVDSDSEAEDGENGTEVAKKAMKVALANALESAVESDVRSDGVREIREIPIDVDEAGREERTPLLRDGRRMRRSTYGSHGLEGQKNNNESQSGGWFGWKR